jgi:hypothetical protein
VDFSEHVWKLMKEEGIGQGPPPGTLQPSWGVQGDAWTRSEPFADEAVAAEGWFISFHDGDVARLTGPRLRRQAPDPANSGLADLFGGEEWLSV